jgi:hypothetical protein
MSFEEHWSYDAAPDPAAVQRAAEAIAAELGVTGDWRGLDDGGGWSIEVAEDDMARVEAALIARGAVVRGPEERGDPFQDGVFTLTIVLDVGRRWLELYSNTDDNRAGWHVAYRFADLLAQRTGATASTFFDDELDDDDDDDDDDEIDDDALN